MVSMNKLKVGITGGIGCGKSTVAGIVKEMGYDVIDADKIAKDIMHNDISVKEALIEEFGRIVFKDNTLNTDFLRAKVFSDKEKLTRLNSIVHPATIDKIYDLMNNSLKDHDLVFVESALIFEAKMDKVLDLIVLVLADEEIKIQRTIERDGLSEDQVRKIIDNQLSDNTKKGRADFVLMNNGSIEYLNQNIKFFINLFKSLGSGTDVKRLKREETEEE